MKRPSVRIQIILAVLILVIGPLLVAAVVGTELRWRLNVVALKATGKLDDIAWRELLPMLRPGSGIWLEPLNDLPDPYAVIHSPHTSAHDIATGKALFRSQCEICHGPAARGATAPALVGRVLATGSSDWALFRTIRKGIAGTPMLRHDGPDDDIWRLVSYIQDLGTRQRADDSILTTLSPLPALKVSFDQLRASRSASRDWPTYYGSFNGYRYSSLSEINRRNISQLQARWIYQLPTKGARIEATPIAVAGRLFLTDPEGGVTTLDANTGALLWRFARPAPRDVPLCCVTANRGVAVLDATVFVATLDAHLLALDGTSGKVLWDKVIADYKQGYSSTGAPLVVKNMVITGIAGAEFGVPGFIGAFDARTGEALWRFNTIPKPGEKGNETWAGESWRTGGASTWMTGTYDPELDLIYWGVANPAPDFDATLRLGDNLYSNSVVALHADSGKLAWHFQYTPGDDHDWDSVQTPVLADVADGTQVRKLLLTANRNGFYYVLDRTNGQFLRAAPYVKQTWAERIDPSGRPVKRPEASPTARGVLLYPGAAGGTNWWPPTFSPAAQLFIVPALERPGVFFKTTLPERREGEQMLGGTSGVTSASHYTAVRALEPSTGALRWEYRSASRHDDGDLSGLLSTAGGLVFTSDRSRLIGLDITNGGQLWSFEAGGKIYAPPATYLAGDQQIIAFAAGDVVVGLALPPASQPVKSH